MASGFNEIHSDVRLPFCYVEFDPTQADRGASAMSFNVLLIGQMLPTGTAQPLVPTVVSSDPQGKQFFGQGSQLAQMVSAYVTANNLTKVTAIGCLDSESGVAASGGVVFSGTVTAPTPVCLYVGGVKAEAKVAVGNSAGQVATAMAQAVNAKPDLPVTASADAETATVTLTARHKGLCGNDIDLRFGYYGEEFPGGLSAAITRMSGGAGNPDAMDVIAAMGNDRYHLIAYPWLDAANLVALRDELDSRFNALRQIDGQAVVVKTGTFAQVTTFASALNDKHLTVFASEGSPTLPWADCAACVAVIAYAGSEDPARPFQTLTVPGVLAPAVEDRWSDFPEKNAALAEGVSVRSVNASGQVMLISVITTYRVNAWGAETQAYLYLNTLLTLSYIRYDFNNHFMLKYPRHKLADDDQGKLYGTNQPIMTPNLGRAEAIGLMYKWMRLGLVEAPEDFKNKLVVERDEDNRNRLNFFISPDLVNQFRICATQVSFLI
jgi:phage tail sheath gpL-like